MALLDGASVAEREDQGDLGTSAAVWGRLSARVAVRLLSVLLAFAACPCGVADQIMNGGDQGAPSHLIVGSTTRADGVDVEDCVAFCWVSMDRHFVVPSNRIVLIVPEPASESRSESQAQGALTSQTLAAKPAMASQSPSVASVNTSVVSSGVAIVGASTVTRGVSVPEPCVASPPPEAAGSQIAASSVKPLTGEPILEEGSEAIRASATQSCVRSSGSSVAAASAGVEGVSTAVRGEALSVATTPTASATVPHPDGNPSSAAEPVPVLPPLLLKATGALEKSASHRQASWGDVVTIGLRFENTGDVPISQFWLLDRLDPRLRLQRLGDAVRLTRDKRKSPLGFSLLPEHGEDMLALLVPGPLSPGESVVVNYAVRLTRK